MPLGINIIDPPAAPVLETGDDGSGISNIGITDIVDYGLQNGKTTDEIAGAVKKWRNDAVEYGYKKIAEQEPEKYWRGTAKIDADVVHVLDALRNEEINRQMNAANITDPAAKQDFIARFLEAKETGDDSVISWDERQLADNIRMLATMEDYRHTRNSEVGGIKVGETTLARFIATDSSKKDEKEVMLFFDKPGDQQQKPEIVRIKSVSDTELKKRIKESEEKIEKLKEDLALTEKLATTVTVPFEPGGESGASRVMLEKRKLLTKKIYDEQQKLDGLSSKNGKKFALENDIKELLKNDAYEDKVGDKKLWQDYTRGLTNAILETGMAVATITGNEKNQDYYREALDDLKIVMPGSTRRMLEGGVWNDSLVTVAEGAGMLSDTAIPTGAVTKLGGKALAKALTPLARGAGLRARALRDTPGALAPALSMAPSSFGRSVAEMLNLADAVADENPELAERLRSMSVADGFLQAAIDTGTEMFARGHAPFLHKGGWTRLFADIPKNFVVGGIEEITAGALGRGLKSPITRAGTPDAMLPITEGMATEFSSGGLLEGSVSLAGGVNAEIARRRIQELGTGAPESAMPPDEAVSVNVVEESKTDKKQTSEIDAQKDQQQGESEAERGMVVDEVSGADNIEQEMMEATEQQEAYINDNVNNEKAAANAAILNIGDAQDRVKAEKEAAGEKYSPESPATLAWQIEAFVDPEKPTKTAVLFDGLSSEDLQKAGVEDMVEKAQKKYDAEDLNWHLADTSAGAVLYNADVHAGEEGMNEIVRKAESGRLGIELGYGVSSKPDFIEAAKNGDPEAVKKLNDVSILTLQGPDGMEKVGVVVTPETSEQVSGALQALADDGDRIVQSGWLKAERDRAAGRDQVIKEARQIQDQIAIQKTQKKPATDETKFIEKSEPATLPTEKYVEKAEEKTAEDMDASILTGGNASQRDLTDKPEMSATPEAVKKPAQAAAPTLTPDIAKRLLALSPERQTYPSGKELEQLRQDVLTAITGQKIPKSKAGAGAVRSALAKHFGLDESKMAPTQLKQGIVESLQRIAESQATSRKHKYKSTDLSESSSIGSAEDVESYSLISPQDKARNLELAKEPEESGENKDTSKKFIPRSQQRKMERDRSGKKSTHEETGDVGYSRSGHEEDYIVNTNLPSKDQRKKIGKKTDIPSSMDVVKSLETLLKSLGASVPFRVGRFFKRYFQAIYKYKPRVSRLDDWSNITAAAHEAGHAFMHAVMGGVTSIYLKRVAPKGAYKEMREYGIALYDKEIPRAGYGAEGFAEFFRMYLFDPAQTRTQMPETSQWFENAIKEAKFILQYPGFAKALENTLATIQKLKKANPLEAANANVAWSTFGKSMRERLKIFKASRLVEDWVEEYDILKRLVNDAEKILKRPLKGHENPYLIFSSVRGTAGAVVYEMVHGQMVNTKGEIVLDTAGRPIGGMQEILSPVKKLMLEFHAFIYAKRALDLWSRPEPVNPGISRRHAQILHDSMLAEYPHFAVVAERLHAWQDAVLQYLEDSVPELGEVIKKIRENNHFYIPLSREFDSDEIRREMASAAESGNPLKIIRGSGRKIKPIFDQIILNTYRLVLFANKGRGVRSLIKLADLGGLGDYIEEVPVPKVRKTVNFEKIRETLEEMGINTSPIPKPDEASGIEPEIIAFFDQINKPPEGDPTPIVPYLDKSGKLHFYQVHPQIDDILKGSTRLGQSLNDSNVLKAVLEIPAYTFRLGSTGLSPAFSFFTNPARDLFTLLAQSKASRNPVRILWAYFAELARNIASLLGASPSTARRYFNALGVTGAQPLGPDIGFVRDTVDGLFASPVKRVLRHPLDYLAEALQFLEKIPRQAEMRMMLENMGIKPGMKITQDQADELRLGGKQSTVDFSAGGRIAKDYNRVVPFFNAVIQGGRTMLRTIKDDPVRAFWYAIGEFMLPTLALWAINRDKQWWKMLPYREKMLYWNIELSNGKILQIPKPQEWGAYFSSVPEMLADAAYRKFVEKDPETAARNFDELFGHLYHTTLPDVLPRIAKIAKEQYTNRIEYFDRPIVPKAQLELRPGEQFGDYTSILGRALGRAFPDAISPRKFDALVRQLTGTGGTLLLQISDSVAKKTGLSPIKPEDARDSEITDIPVIGRAFRRGGAYNAASIPIVDFYEAKEKYQALYSSREFPIDAVGKQIHHSLQAAHGVISILQDAIRNTKDPKARMELYKGMSEVAEQALKTTVKGAAGLDAMKNLEYTYEQMARVHDGKEPLSRSDWEKRKKASMDSAKRRRLGLPPPPRLPTKRRDGYDF